MKPKELIFTAAFLLLIGVVFADDFPFIGEVTQDGVNIRSGANINFESLSQAKKGDKLIVKAKAYNWYKIILPQDASCFISAQYVKPADLNSGIVLADRVNIRAKPGEKYSIIGQVGKGEILQIVGKNNGWYEIRPLDNCYGWIHEKFLKFFAPFKEEEVKKEAGQPPEVAAIESKHEPPEHQNSLFEAKGTVVARGKVINRQGSHKLLINGKPAYYLEGQPRVLDTFIHFKVKVMGEKKEIAQSDLPVINVKRITLNR